VQIAIKVVWQRSDCSNTYGFANYGAYKYDLSSTNLGCTSNTNQAQLN